MSLSNPTTIINPAKLNIDWKGSENKFVGYNRETKQTSDMPKEMYIIVLDQLVSITGYSESQNTGIYSNEIKYSTTEELVVQTKNGIAAKGLYRDIKDKIKVLGGNFTKSVYACLITPQEKGQTPKLELVNFKMAGSALRPWGEAKPGDDGCVIKLTINNLLLKKGRTEYYSPTIEKLSVRQDILDLAVSLDRDLQKYLTARNSNIVVEQEVADTPDIDGQAFENSEMPEINMDEITVQMPF
jgi:hypothetical protein